MGIAWELGPEGIMVGGPFRDMNCERSGGDLAIRVSDDDGLERIEYRLGADEVPLVEVFVMGGIANVA